MKIEFRCDLAGARIPLKHFWEYCVGSDHATVALRKDWQMQLKRCHQELGFERVRFHGLLSDDVGTLVSKGGKIVYSFFNADQILCVALGLAMSHSRGGALPRHVVMVDDHRAGR